MHVAGPDPWQCKVHPEKGQAIEKVTADLQSFISTSSCKNNIGATVMVDRNDRTWAFITTDPNPTQYTFCHPDPKGLGVGEEESDAEIGGNGEYVG
ncbi:hypothetical protein N7508_000392 [Penicillium antarcticum]|uniref:uncharacterized protein n=1 Tax=Penicillium antarcticum TaxID=416450 RepID=UPI00238E9BAA|nr:uncharacterized protein N7508_000392 [Penicillium antarcticum]KAJ5320109.1 hypothetical protein N7508_000392 [Penicillium antarcticum]